MYNKILLALLVLLITPSVTLAAWWNPFSWSRSIPITNEVATSTSTDAEQANILMADLIDVSSKNIDLGHQLEDNQKQIASLEQKLSIEVTAYNQLLASSQQLKSQYDADLNEVTKKCDDALIKNLNKPVSAPKIYLQTEPTSIHCTSNTLMNGDTTYTTCN